MCLMIGVVQDHKPWNVLKVIEPLANQFTNIHLWILVSWKPELRGYILVCLHKSCLVRSIHPQDMTLQILFAKSMGILNRDLRLPNIYCQCHACTAALISHTRCPQCHIERQADLQGSQCRSERK